MSDRCLLEGAVNYCYCDESGMGNEPFAVMVGVLVDAGRMHLTKQDWRELLAELNRRTKRNRDITELKTADFYAGHGEWRDIDGEERSDVIDAILDWLIERKHHLTYSAVSKAHYFL